MRKEVKWAFYIPKRTDWNDFEKEVSLNGLIFEKVGKLRQLQFGIKEKESEKK